MKTVKITFDHKNGNILVELFDTKRRLVRFEVFNDSKEIPNLLDSFFCSTK